MRTNHEQGGAALLQVWMDDKGYSQREAAQLFGVHESLISHVLARRRSVSLRLANRISALTDGAVPLTSWAEPVAATDADAAA